MINVIFEGEMTNEEDDIISQVIARVYSEHFITDNPATWKYSKKLKIQMIYDTLKRMYEERVHFIDASGDDSQQRAARKMLLRLNLKIF